MLPAPLRNAPLWGGAIVFISLGAWTMEWTGIVEPCIYCQIERSVIGLLGVLLILPFRNWWTRYAGSVIALFGAATAAAQHLNGWKAIQDGSFAGFDPLYANGFLLSAAALVLIVGAWLVLWEGAGRPASAAA